MLGLFPRLQRGVIVVTQTSLMQCTRPAEVAYQLQADVGPRDHFSKDNLHNLHFLLYSSSDQPESKEAFLATKDGMKSSVIQR